MLMRLPVSFLCLIFLAPVIAAGLDVDTGIISNERWGSGVPLGGLGCGKLEILTDGAFGYYTGNHNQDRQTGRLKGAFAAIYAECGDRRAARMLRLTGESEYAGVRNIDNIDYAGWFPTAEITYRDAALPVNVKLLAWSPLIPHNIDDSSLPVACLRFTITNPGNKPARAVLLVAWPNLAGWGGDGSNAISDLTGNTAQPLAAPGVHGLLFSKAGAPAQPQNELGTYALCVTDASAPAGSKLVLPSFDAAGDSLPFWDSFSRSGDITLPMQTTTPKEHAALVSATVTLKPRETRRIEYLLVWHFPDFITTRHPQNSGKHGPENVGHWYGNRFKSAGEIAVYTAANTKRLLNETLEWQNLVRRSNLPAWLKLKLVNCAFPLYACSILTRDGRFTTMESPVDMGGATGTMDQRMASHAFLTQMFPELDQRELRLFADCQQMAKPSDGRITHMNGNIHEVIGDPNVTYGVTDWPDLSCSFIMQVLKLYRWTGDRKFLDEMWPHVLDALAWLQTADTDGDFIPEGGSTYDYEDIPRGSFSYSAGCYLGALRAGIDIARIEGDAARSQAYADRFASAQQSVMQQLWTGEYFRKLVNVQTGEKRENSFIAPLAGDWLSRLSASGRTLSPEITDKAIAYILQRHVKPFSPVPPMEVTPDGRIATGSCYLLQYEPYVGCEAINEGYVDDGLDVIKRVYNVVWEQNHNPWHQTLSYSAPSGSQGGLVSYMTCPTTWHVLNALSGSTIDVPVRQLYLSPRLPTGQAEWHMPLFFSRCWLWLDYAPARRVLRLTVVKTFGAPVTIEQIAPDSDAPSIELRKPFTMRLGARLDLSSYLNRLVVYPASKTIVQ